MNKLGTAVDIRSEADSCRLIKDLVAGGMGYAILPRSYFREEYRQGSLRCCAIVTPKLMLMSYLSYRTNHRATVNSVEAKVIATISQMLRQEIVERE